MNHRRIIVAGGSGFLGQALARHLQTAGREVVLLTRHPAATNCQAREVGWDGSTLGRWAEELDGAEAVINLCGRSVNCRYTARNRRVILESRVQPTRILGEAIVRCDRPPAVWLNASSATIHRHTFGSAWDETATDFNPSADAKDTFSLEVIHAWEKALGEAPTPRTRKLALRTTMVLGHARNSVFPALRRLARLGLGGRMGGGRQYVSWIHETDFCRAVHWLIEREEISGPVNLAAPNPLSNAEMMGLLRSICGAPRGLGLPATRWMLEIGALLLRTETELILKSRRVIPSKLAASGFRFQFPDFAGALKDLNRDCAA